MKKIIRVFLLLVSVVSISGCKGKDKVFTDLSSLEYLEDTSQENIAHNLNLAVSSIKGVSFVGNIKVNDKSYGFIGELILNDSLKNSEMHIKYDEGDLYVKNNKVYLNYKYKNTNFILKDDVDKFVDEIIEVLEYKGIGCNESKIDKILNSNVSTLINFDDSSKLVEKIDNGYVINEKNNKIILDEKYLPISYMYTSKDVVGEITFQYNSVSVDVPLGYKLLNFNLDDAKNILGVENFSQFIK